MKAQKKHTKKVSKPKANSRKRKNDRQKSPTPYDDVFRSMLKASPSLVIPVLNEVFGTDFTSVEPIEQVDGVFFITGPDGKQSKRIVDAYLKIRSRSFHLECQSTMDGTMLIRMFEYDAQIGIDNHEMDSEGITIRFPESGIMYLRSKDDTPDHTWIRIVVPGDSCRYRVPILKVKDYDTEKIYARKLYFLIPFFSFAFEDRFKAGGPDDIPEGVLDEMEQTYVEIRSRLEDAVEQGILTEHDKFMLIALSKKVLETLARDYPTVQERVGVAMHDNIMDFEAHRILENGMAIGKKDGIEIGRKDGIKIGKQQAAEEYHQKMITMYHKMLRDGMSSEVALNYLDLKPADVLA